LDVCGVDRSDLVLALLDDFAPTAVEEHASSLRAFFSDSRARDAARAALVDRYAVEAVDVADEDWARRSQENLAPVTIGRITILPGTQHLAPGTQHLAPGTQHLAPGTQHLAPSTGTQHLAPGTQHLAPSTGTQHLAPGTQHLAPGTQHLAPSTGTQHLAPGTQHPITLLIPPSMGFGTGHHATTRLCLRALQTRDLTDSVVLDVGTGSGVLAIAAVCLGARQALGIDSDADAIQAASENLSLNPGVSNVRFEVADLTSASLPEADIVTANLTGALLARAAPVLAGAVGRRGTLVISGLLAHERAEVLARFVGFDLAWEEWEDDWPGMALIR
jgi:ribosomal protein L11 methylase PrmA